MIAFILQTALCVVVALLALIICGMGWAVWRLLQIIKEGNNERRES